MSGHFGESTSTVEYSPEKLQEIKAALARRERYWARRASEVEAREATAEDLERLRELRARKQSTSPFGGRHEAS